MADNRQGKTSRPTLKRDTGLPNSPFTPMDTLRVESPVTDSQGGFLNSLGGHQPGGIPSGHYGDHFYGGQFGGQFNNTASGHADANIAVDYDKIMTSGDSNVVAQATATLQSEINAIQDSIRTLSMKRSRTVRADIGKMFSDCSSQADSDTVVHIPQHRSKRPPRSTVEKKGKSGKCKEGLATEPRKQTDVCFNVVNAPDDRTSREGNVSEGSKTTGEVAHKGKSEVSTKSSPAPRTQTRVEDCLSVNAPDVGLATKTSACDKSRRKPLKLERYDGVTMPLETFLAKYGNCKRYNEWTDEESAVFLRDSLTGNASQVLWEIPDEASHDEIIRLLRNRFGNSNQMERYRAELHARRRKRGESVQVVYQDIRKLMALGFPGQSGELYEVIAKDAFLNSLGDPALRIRVLDQQPKTLDDALSAVVRMEAYSEAPTTDDDNVERKRVRVVSPARETDADRRLRKLEEYVEQQNQEIRQLRIC